MRDLVVILLAAGQGQRYRAAGGGDKLLALYRGKPMVQHAAAAALATGLPVMAVTGHAAREVRAALEGLPLQFVPNAAFANGLASSLQAGIAALVPGTKAALIMLADMPEIRADVPLALVEAHGRHPSAYALIPTYQGERGNPVLLTARAFGDVMQLTGDQGARKLLAGRTDVVDVPVADAAILKDVDVPEGSAP